MDDARAPDHIPLPLRWKEPAGAPGPKVLTAAPGRVRAAAPGDSRVEATLRPIRLTDTLRRKR